MRNSRIKEESFSSMQVKGIERGILKSGEGINNSTIFKTEEQNSIHIKAETSNESEICTNIEEKVANSKKKSSVKNANEGKRTPKNKQKSVGSSNITVKEEKTDIQIKPVIANSLEISVKEESDLNNSKNLTDIPSVHQVKEEKTMRGKKNVSFNSAIQVKIEGETLHSNQDAIENSTAQSANVKKVSSTKKKLSDKTTSSVKKEPKATQSSKSSVKSSTTRIKKEKVPSISDQKVESTSTSNTTEPLKPKETKSKSSTTRVKKEKLPSISDQKVASTSISTSSEPPKQKVTKAKTSSPKKSQATKTPIPIAKNLDISELLKESDNDTEDHRLNQNPEELGKLEQLEQLENLTSNDYNTRLINRSLRKEYRKLHADLTESQNNLSENRAQRVKDHVEIANELYTMVNGTFEATLDSKVLILAADMSVKLAKELKASTMPFNLDLFKNCLLDKLKIEDNYDSDSNESESNEKSRMPIIDKEKWKYFNLIASKQIQPVGGLRILTGPLSLKHKPRARRSTRNKLKISDELTVVQEANYKESDLENTTTANVVIVANTLEKCGPINLFKFVINPQSYGQTVENIFFLSFLIRDGKARIEVDEDNHPILTRCKPPTHEDHRMGLTKKQWLFEIDELMWRGMVKLFDLKKSIIPHRNYESNDDDGSPTWK